jgi:outer membrane protein assembly factor BamB
MKKIFILLIIFVLTCTPIYLIALASREDIRIYGSNWTPGFFEVASSVSYNGKFIYVADVNNSRIQVYDNSFKPLFWFGGYGQKIGAFIEITGLNCSGRTTYVTSIDSHSEKKGRLQSFSEDGILKAVFAEHNGRSDYLKASELSNGNIVAITEETFCIFSNTGKFLKEFSDIAGEVFLSIKDITTFPPYGFAFIDKNKRGFFVVDNELKSIKVYGEEYVYLPSAIAYNNGTFFVADSSGKIFIFDNDKKFKKSIETNIYIQAIEAINNDTLVIASLLKRGLIVLNIETSATKTIQIEPKNALELHWPVAICLDNNDLIYISDDYSGGLKIISSKDGSFSGISGILNDLALRVRGVSAINKNEIYVLSETDLSKIYKFNEDKFDKTLNIDKAASFIRIKSDNAGNIYALDKLSNSVYKFTNDNFVKEFKITQKENIVGLYVKDYIYITTETGDIGAFDLSSGKIKFNFKFKDIPKVITNFDNFAVTDNLIILGSRFNHKIYSFSLKDGSFIKEIGGVGGPKTYSPQSNMQVDISYEPLKFLFPEELFYKNGFLYVVDSGNGRVQAIPEDYFLYIDRVIELKIGSKKAKIDGKDYNLDTPPIIINGRTLVPVRFIAEGFNAEVKWDNKTRKVTIMDNNTTIELWINQTKAKIDGKDYNLDTPPIIINGRTLVPVRFIAEGFNAEVKWDNKNQIVTIRKKI